MKISEFFENDYVDQASYDNLRKIASLVDGLKNSSRKIVYTILEKNIKDEIKVSQLGSKVSEFAEYLHGNLDGVIVNLAQDFAGTNNIPLLTREGNFGTRFAQSASASRYIYTYGSKEFFQLFNKNDNNILIKQYFEGTQIEPMFFVPTLPLLLINGSDGVSSGFAQKILSRDPKKIKKAIKQILEQNEQIERNDGTSYNDGISNLLIPYFEGFTGVVEQGENHAQWLIKGIIQRKSINRVEISEVPVGYDLKGYINVLDDLEDKKIIQSYKDKSENDKFLFEVQINSKDLKEWDDDTLLNKLKLQKKVSENYTCTNEFNKIQVFENATDILKRYIDIKLDFLQKRKDYQIQTLSSEIKFDFSKYLFIQNIVLNKLIINKRKKSDIEIDMDKIENILRKDGSFDYLLNMNILSLTEERMQKLQDEIKSKKEQLDKLQKQNIKDIWIEEL